MQAIGRQPHRALDGAPVHCERHRPEQTTLYRNTRLPTSSCHVIPHVPARQWVLSLPIPLRLLLAGQPKRVTPVLPAVHRAITRFLLDQAGLKAEQADGGAVTLIQRFGSAANLNLHLHRLGLDGVYRRSDVEPDFVEVPAPSDEALQAQLHKIIGRLMKLLTRRGVLVEEEGSSHLADSDADADDARALRPLQAAAGRCRPLQAAACTYRIAFGPCAGQKVFTVQGAMPPDAAFTQALCADEQGFSLHAAVRCGARRCAAAPMTACQTWRKYSRQPSSKTSLWATSSRCRAATPASTWGRLMRPCVM